MGCKICTHFFQKLKFNFFFVQNYVQILIKQVNPKNKEKFGQDLGEENLNKFNDNQVRQLYELFKETTGKKND